MIGAVGDDPFGRELLENLHKEGVDASGIEILEGTSSGVAVIVVDSKGENAIVVASGANARVTPDDHLFPNEALFQEAEVVVLQMELPLPTVHAAIMLAHRHGCKVILDPAPASKKMSDEFFDVDIISPNMSEAAIITGQQIGMEERVDKLIASDLIARGAKATVLKLGHRGSMAVTADGHIYTVPAYKVDVVDTTAAGDCFTAALAVATANQMHLHETLHFANAAGALACTRPGAQQSAPTYNEVKFLMEDQKL